MAKDDQTMGTLDHFVLQLIGSLAVGEREVPIINIFESLQTHGLIDQEVVDLAKSYIK